MSVSIYDDVLDGLLEEEEEYYYDEDEDEDEDGINDRRTRNRFLSSLDDEDWDDEEDWDDWDDEEDWDDWDDEEYGPDYDDDYLREF